MEDFCESHVEPIKCDKFPNCIGCKDFRLKKK